MFVLTATASWFAFTLTFPRCRSFFLRKQIIINIIGCILWERTTSETPLVLGVQGRTHTRSREQSIAAKKFSIASTTEIAKMQKHAGVPKVDVLENKGVVHGLEIMTGCTVWNNASRCRYRRRTYGLNPNPSWIHPLIYKILCDLPLLIFTIEFNHKGEAD